MKKKKIIIQCDSMPNYIDFRALRRSINAFKKSGLEVEIIYKWPIGSMSYNI